MEELKEKLPLNAFMVGLDIGTTKISVMVGRKNEFGKLEILGSGRAISSGVNRGIVSNIDKTVSSIKSAIMEQHNLTVQYFLLHLQLNSC